MSVSWFVLAGCRHSSNGELGAPAGASAWDTRLDQLFDDRFTPTAIELTGRAPGDVLDQRRFSQRLGYANVIVLVTVDQVWSRTLFGGQPQQRVEVTLGRNLRGSLPRKTTPSQVLVLRQAEELPADAVGRVMLLFVAWAPGEIPAYHHHLMPADEKVIELIEAMVRHARKAGSSTNRTAGRSGASGTPKRAPDRGRPPARRSLRAVSSRPTKRGVHAAQAPPPIAKMSPGGRLGPQKQGTKIFEVLLDSEMAPEYIPPPSTRSTAPRKGGDGSDPASFAPENWIEEEEAEMYGAHDASYENALVGTRVRKGSHPRPAL
ncbi:hypothetical protein [Nannocystis pusilla]|uniref:hypothetical protein n=1 Tax=Nannocystis pusilla TaxID=889268 RepID=UPI003B7C9E2E